MCETAFVTEVSCYPSVPLQKASDTFNAAVAATMFFGEQGIEVFIVYEAARGESTFASDEWNGDFGSPDG